MALVKCKACGNEISKKAEACPKCGEKPKKTSIFTWIITTLVVLYMLGHFAANVSNNNVSDASGVPSTQEAINNIKLDFSWGKEGFGSVMVANFTIHNNGSHDVKDLEIKCIYSAPSGTVIDQNTQTIYELFKAKSTKKVHNFNMGFVHSQATRSNCFIDSLTFQ